MTVAMEIMIYLFVFYIGFMCGKYFGRKEVNLHNVNVGMYYQNQAKKQAAEIKQMKERMTYLTVGELEEFVEYLKDEEDGYGVKEDYPVLAIVGNLGSAEIDLTEDE